MKNKYYAVAKGKVPGIYTIWSECEAQVKNFKGARFKSFRTKDLALKYMADEGPSQSALGYENTSNVDLHIGIRSNIPNIYVAGNFSGEHNSYLWSFVDIGNAEYFRYGIGNNEKYLASEAITGEVVAILQAVDYSIKEGYAKVALVVSSNQFKDWMSELSSCTSEISKSFNYLMSSKLLEIDIMLVVQESWSDRDIIKKLKSRAKHKQFGS